jgi:phage FluMu protein Com
MPQTIQCNKCGVVLNLPAHVAPGKRLKCPRCATRFVVSETDASSISTVPGAADAALTAFDLEKRPPSTDDLPNATSEGDLRDTFDLPLISGRDAGRDAEQGGAVSTGTADAAGLFADHGTSKRRPTAAEARARARRCSHCGGGVPPGMSICQTCGTDQETGLRVGLEDDLAPPPPSRPDGPPLHVAIVGGLCGTGGLILALVGAIKSTRGESSLENYGWLVVALVAAFGIFACVQLLRGRSARTLMLALTLGVVVDLVGMVAYPIVKTFLDDPTPPVLSFQPEDPNDPNPTSFLDKFDAHRVGVGAAVLVLYAVLSLYLMSPQVKKYIFRCRPDREF